MQSPGPFLIISAIALLILFALSVTFLWYGIRFFDAACDYYRRELDKQVRPPNA